MTLLIVTSVLLLAFANGANDNFKGVATLFGSGTTNYRGALVWATVTTLLGSAAAVWLAGSLLVRFSGKGLVPDATVADPQFAAAVAAGAGLTVLLATRLGFPISTTHALVGAMVGAGASYSGEIHGTRLLATFVTPLLVSPLVAICATSAVYPLFQATRRRLGIDRHTCVCVGQEQTLETCDPSMGGTAVAMLPASAPMLAMTLDATEACRERYAGTVCGVEAAAVLDALHFLSAGLVSFARGLNDTPKIAALLLLAPSVGPSGAVLLSGVVIAIGGIAAARRVAESMSRRITAMNPGQGFTANLLTGLLVISASHWGLPVSTTHVSCGALFGIGLVNRQARWRFILQILLAWITTLPVAAVAGWLLTTILHHC